MEVISNLKSRLMGAAAAVIAAVVLFCAAAAADICAVSAGEIIYPLPQHACLTGVLKAPEAVRVLMSGVNPGEQATAYGLRLLKSYGLSLLEEDSDGGAAPAGRIVFEHGGPEHETRFRQEGYSIKISGEPFEVRIGARSPAGFLYAILTLEQLIHWSEDGLMVYSGEVRDFPRFAYRGVLEGGYSVWSHEKRLAVLRWMGSLKMNSFIYAPKEGMYFRRRWRALYPDKELDEFRQYLAVCREWDVEFAYSLSPALSIEYSDPAEFARLVAKYRQLQEIGVNRFGIFFDDVLPYLSTPADRAAYSHIAEAEVDVTNRLLVALREYDPGAKLFFVPNQYWGWTPTRYMEIVRDNLNPEIEIGWTGVDIVSKTITTEHALEFEKLVGRPPAIGDNWSPLGPVENRSADLYTVCDTYLNNPYAFAEAERAELSKFVNSTVADYSWNPEGYDPQRSIRMAAWRLAGSATGGDALLLALRTGRRGVAPRFLTYLTELIDELQSSGEMEAIIVRDRLRDELVKYKDALDGIDSAPISPLLKIEIKPAVDSAITAIPLAIAAIDEMSALEKRRQLAETLRELLGLKK